MGTNTMSVAHPSRRALRALLRVRPYWKDSRRRRWRVGPSSASGVRRHEADGPARRRPAEMAVEDVGVALPDDLVVGNLLPTANLPDPCLPMAVADARLGRLAVARFVAIGFDPGVAAGGVRVAGLAPVLVEILVEPGVPAAPVVALRNDRSGEGGEHCRDEGKRLDRHHPSVTRARWWSSSRFLSKRNDSLSARFCGLIVMTVEVASFRQRADSS